MNYCKMKVLLLSIIADLVTAEALAVLVSSILAAFANGQWMRIDGFPISLAIFYVFLKRRIPILVIKATLSTILIIGYLAEQRACRLRVGTVGSLQVARFI